MPGEAVRKSWRALAVTTIIIAAPTVGMGCGGNSRDNVNLISGKQLFVGKCGSCHTLARAGTKGTVGPDLDEAFRADVGAGLGRTSIRGVVRTQILYPPRGSAMPAKLVTGQKASDVAAYVAAVAAQPGQDSGLLAGAVKPVGAGKPVAEAGGRLEIDADPSGQLAFITNKASGTAGSATLTMKNPAQTPHNIAVQQGTNGPVLGAGKIVTAGGVSTVSVSLKPGTYTYFCQVPGHRAAGMLGTLTVK